MRELAPYVLEFGGTVVELGSRDGHDAKEMSSLFRAARTVVIEANPDCFADIERDYPEFESYNCAISNKTEPMDFWKMSHSLDPDSIGQSSTLDRDIYEANATKIVVNAFTMDDFTSCYDINYIEVMKIDVEGATYQVLEGFSKIRMTRVLHIESEHRVFWPGQKLYEDTALFMINAGYEQVYFQPVFEAQSDSIWLRKD